MGFTVALRLSRPRLRFFGRPSLEGLPQNDIGTGRGASTGPSPS